MAGIAGRRIADSKMEGIKGKGKDIGTEKIAKIWGGDLILFR